MTATSEDEAREILASATPYVTVTEQGIIIAAGYSDALARLLRWVPKATWRPDKRAWLVPLAGTDALRSVLPEILRLAEAATEKSSMERPAAAKAGTVFGETWLAAIGQAVGRGNEDIAALMRSPTNAFDPEAIGTAIMALRGEAAKLIGAADRLEAWLRGARQDGNAE